MRTILNIKWYILGIFATLMFTSCLSDSDSFVQGTGTGYVTTSEGSKYLAFPFGYFSANGVQNLQTGSYYLVDYRIEDLNPVKNVYPGQILSIYKNKPLEESYLKVEEVPAEDAVSVRGITPMDRTNGRELADGWTFYFLPKEGAKKVLEAYFYYDVENQIDKDDKDVSTESNKVIIDVKFEESSQELDATELGKLQIVVAKFGELRNTFEADFSESKPDNDGNKFANVAIQFRFDGQDGDKAQTKYVGGWDSKDPYNYYHMTFTEE